jgi:RimJ/RimL family protein N-acetyltransferase
MRNPLVVGNRLYLRPLEKSDAEVVARHIASEPETFMDRGRVPISPIALEQYIEERYKQQPPENVALAVCLKADDTYIGSVDLFDIDWLNRTAETGAWLDNPEYRNKGYGTEAKMLLLEYAFDHLQLHVLNSYVWEPNWRSAHALSKQGYRPSGRLKWEDVKDGVHRDALLFDVLRDEWIAARDEWRKQQATM